MISMDLLIVIFASLALVPLAILGEGALRLVLGLIFVLFFPGYTLIAALFPKRDDLDGPQRVALSFGLSIAVVPLIGLIMNYTIWGISLYSMLVSILAFIIIMAGIAWYRRRRLPREQRFNVRFRFVLSLLSGWSHQSRRGKILIGLLVVAMIGILGTMVYIIQVPKDTEKFTEFYILGPEGKAENYPRVVTLGEEADVILVIVNHEYETTQYRVQITVDGDKVEEIGPLTLTHEEKWEQKVSLASERIGEDQKVELQLYMEPNEEPYFRLHLWISVVESS